MDEVQFRFRQLSRFVNGLYVNPSGDGALTMSMRQRGELGTEVRVVRFSDIEMNQLDSVHWVLLGDR